MSNGSFDFNEFIKDSKDVLVNPNYFSTMKLSGGMTEPLIKAVIYGAISGLISFVWSILHLSVGGSLFGGAAGVTAFIFAIIGAVIGLFIGGVVLLILSAICKGSTDFEPNVRVVSSLMVVMPINALLGFATGLNLYLGLAVSLVVSLFACWLTYKALVQALKAKPETAKIVMFVVIAVFVLFMLFGLYTTRKASQFMNNFNSEELKELMEQVPTE
ncbi:MAG TPA: YIP1 family protein [Bacteroidales bacterium]|nr:YIP1 family protein [Bacteroidales bacterium]